MRRLIALALCVAAAATVVAGCGSAGLGEGEAPPPTIAAKDRDPAPSFSVPALDGDGRVSLSGGRGRPVVVNFWASWCEPCKRETPEVVAFAHEHPEIDVIGLATTDRISDARAFARSHRIPYALGVDRKGDVGHRYGIAGLPTTIVVDCDGRVFVSWSGPITRADLDRFAREIGCP